MRLTAKAQTLRPRLAALLGDVAAVLDPPAPNLATLRQAVRLVMADLPGALVAARLPPLLATSAPGIDIAILPWRGADATLDLLARDAADLAVSVVPAAGRDFRREIIGEEAYCCAMRAGHPAADNLTLETWLAYPHVLVSGTGALHGAVDDALAEGGLARRVGLVVPSFLMVPAVLEGSDYIATLPRRAGTLFASGQLIALAPPLAVPGFPLHLVWHMRRDRDLAVRHVAALVRSVLSASPDS